jgi:hypothetical protein
MTASAASLRWQRVVVTFTCVAMPCIKASAERNERTNPQQLFMRSNSKPGLVRLSPEISATMTGGFLILSDRRPRLRRNNTEFAQSDTSTTTRSWAALVLPTPNYQGNTRRTALASSGLYESQSG